MNGSGFFHQIKRGFARLSDFSGRDRPGQFWPYAAAIFVLTQVGGMMATIPLVITQVLHSLSTAERLAQAHPEDWQVTRAPGSVSYHYVGNDPAVLRAMLPDFSAILLLVGLIAVVTIALMAAAVTRRLHDRGRSGLWAAIPAALLMVAIGGMHNVLGSIAGAAAQPGGGAMMGSILPVLALNFVYLAAIITLIIQLVLAGQAVPNRFGPPPQP